VVFEKGGVEKIDITCFTTLVSQVSKLETSRIEITIRVEFSQFSRFLILQLFKTLVFKIKSPTITHNFKNLPLISKTKLISMPEKMNLINRKEILMERGMHTPNYGMLYMPEHLLKM